jgi:hypothetical protein
MVRRPRLPAVKVMVHNVGKNVLTIEAQETSQNAKAMRASMEASGHVKPRK